MFQNKSAKTEKQKFSTKQTHTFKIIDSNYVREQLKRQKEALKNRLQSYKNYSQLIEGYIQLDTCTLEQIHNH